MCIQCGKCVLVCPHAAIRAKVYDPNALGGAPETYKSVDYKGKDFAWRQIHDPGRAGRLHRLRRCASRSVRPRTRATRATRRSTWPRRCHCERRNAQTTISSSPCPEVDRTQVKIDVKGSQFFQPLFEYSGACAGCGETPYVKLLTQLFGDRALISNATGCSSIYGGNLPTTPYCANSDGRGPAWSNSLFEDNAEFGLGFRLAVDKTRIGMPNIFCKNLSADIGDTLVTWQLLTAEMTDEIGIAAQREAGRPTEEGQSNRSTAPRPGCLASWSRLPGQKACLGGHGGDGWAYDIGLWRPRPRPRRRTRRQYSGSGYRRLLQHGRSSLQGHTDGRNRQVRHGRQIDRKERPRIDGDGLRPRLCRPGRLRRQGSADNPGRSRKQSPIQDPP